MSEFVNAIELKQLIRKFGKTDAVNGLDLVVRPGCCYGFFGPNGAGKTTTIKCLLNHLRPTAGTVRIFGMDPAKEEVAVKLRIGYVPEAAGFYPWMTTRSVLKYTAAFYPSWNRELEIDLLKRFNLEESKKVKAMSKGMKAKLSLICALCPEPDLLLLDEPTSGLDPIVRQELIQTVIGAYQERNPEQRTIFVATHMLHEFEGIVDEFTIMNQGRTILTLDMESAKQRFKKIWLRFAGDPPEIQEKEVMRIQREGREVQLVTANYSEELMSRLQVLAPESVHVETLSLEEIFIAVAR